jgi:hypothetical protein
VLQLLNKINIINKTLTTLETEHEPAHSNPWKFFYIYIYSPFFGCCLSSSYVQMVSFSKFYICLLFLTHQEAHCTTLDLSTHITLRRENKSHYKLKSHDSAIIFLSLQQLGTDVYDYKVLNDYQVNLYVAPDGSKPFQEAPDSQRAVCSWRQIWAEQLLDRNTCFIILEMSLNYPTVTSLLPVLVHYLSAKFCCWYNSQNLGQTECHLHIGYIQTAVSLIHVSWIAVIHIYIHVSIIRHYLLYYCTTQDGQ